MRVLIVDDDPRLSSTVRRGLEREGFGVDLAVDGTEGIAMATAAHYDAVVLDVMLPGSVDGVDVCAQLRARKYRTPILMLTALDDIADRVRGLDAGADDYLVKPFAFAELMARIRSITRRTLEERSPVIDYGDLHLDTIARSVTVLGRPVDLTMKELAVLEHFMRHPGQLITTTQIEEHVWNYDYVAETNVVKVYVARIRRKLADAGMPDPIVTVRNGGYRFVPEQLSSPSSAGPAPG